MVHVMSGFFVASGAELGLLAFAKNAPPSSGFVAHITVKEVKKIFKLFFVMFIRR